VSDDGTKAYVLGSLNAVIYQYSLTGSDVTKLQPEYLLANTLLFSGTGLQNFLTRFDASDWNTTNVYFHEVDSANNSSSVVELNTSGGQTITGSSVSAPDNRGQSSGMCPFSDGNLDTKATTNNGDIYATRILVQVGNTDSCSGGGAQDPATTGRHVTLRGNVFIRGGARFR
jgi:hypothetical protein